MAAIQLQGVKVVRGTTLVLEIDHLAVEDGELLVVLGPSGAGKSMLLRAIAGLEPLASGKVFFDGQDMADVETAHRAVAMVFQDSTLYPFLDVRNNVGFPLQIRKTPKDEITARVEAEARVLEIEHLLGRRPGELSAGHQQLVQAARAMVRVPEVFLMDEPLARLDAHLRVQLRHEFRLLQRGYGVTTVLVTNDRDEAMVMADRIAVIDRGLLRQVGSPLDLYRSPSERFVAGFIGAMGFVSAELSVDAPGYWVTFGAFRVRAWATTLAGATSDRVDVGIRPEEVVIDQSGTAVVCGRGYYTGSNGFVQLEVAPGSWVEMRTDGPPPPAGTEVRVRFKRVHVFDSITGSVLGCLEDVGR